MKGKKFLSLFIALILAMLLCAALVFVASAEENEGGVLYEVTLSDGSVKEITEKKDFNALYTSYSNVVKIKLYSDLEIAKVGTSASNSISKNLEIDLNDYAIKTNGGYLRPEASAEVLVHNGKIVHSLSYFAFINSATAKLVVRDCEITATFNFIHQRDGDVAVESSTVTSSVASDNGFVQMSYAGKTSNLKIDCLTFADAKMCLVQIARNNLSVLKNVDIKDTVFSTSKSVITFGDDTTASNNTLSCVTSVKFSGNTKLSFASFVKKDGLLPATFNFASGVKVSSIPSANAGSTALAKIAFVDGATEFADNTDSDKDTYPKITLKSDVFYALTKTDGSIVNVSETKSFYALISEYGAINKIKLFADLEIQAVSGSASNYINKDLEIDLNDKCIKTNGGYLRPDGSCEVLVHGGKISHASSSFVFINSADAKCIIDNCTMDVTYNFLQLRAGSFTVSNSTITSASDSSGAFAAISYVGAVSNLLLDGVTFESAKFPIISVGRDANTVSKNITVKDSVISTTKQIISFIDQSNAAADATVKVNIVGKTKLSFNKFVNVQAALPEVTSFTFDEGVLLSTDHNITAGSILFNGGADGFLENDDEVYKVIVSNTSPRYLVKKSDGSEVKVFGIATLQDLFKIADSGSVITLLGDVDLSAEVPASYITNKNVEINLNGYTFTNSGARFRAYGNSKITFYGGKVVDSAEKQFLFTGGSEEDKQLSITFRDCEITADTSFIQLRNGSLAFEDCIVNANNVSVLVSFSYAGVDASLLFDGCTVNAGNAILVSIMRNESEAARKVSIIDSTVNANGSLIKFEDSAINEKTVTDIEILGSSKIKCKYIDNGTNTYENTVFKFDLGVKMTVTPVISIGRIEFGEGAEGFTKVDDDEYPYAVVSNIPLSVRLQFALAFYTDFSLNVCFDESEFSKIIEVKHDGKVLEYKKGYGKYTYPIKGISPLTIDQKQEISITYYNYGLKTTKTVEYSVMDYVNALMKSNYSIESKQLICRAVDYAAAVFEYADTEVPTEISEFVASEQYKNIGNSEWENSVPESATNVGELYTVMKSANFVINTGIKLRFYLNDNIGSGILTVRSRTVNETYTVENSLINGCAYFDFDMRAFEYYNGIVNITFGDITGSYDFKTYANSEAVKENENGDVEVLTVAMYNYFREANEYSLVSDKDFNPTASVVVKDGKTGTVTYIFDDGDVRTGEYTAEMLRDYENLKISYGLIGEKYATLETVYNAETGKYEYVLDENGKYVYTVNESAASFWRALVAEFSDRIEYTSHTYTHDFAGFDDEGGTIQYVDTSGNIQTVTLPKGSASAELYATIQIFNDLFGEDALTVVEPGVPANRGDIIVDGVLYRGYYAYYTELLLKLYEEGLLVGARGAGVTCNEEYIITPDALADLEVRFNMHAYSLRHTQTVESWKQYVDFATESGGWALIMLHRIYADGTAGVDHVIHTKESETRELFEYTNRDDVWVTTLTEATKYYSEWATSTVSTEMGDGKIILTVTDTENNDVYDEALTVKVTVPTSWEFCIVNGEEIKVTAAEDGVRYIYVDVIPDSGDVEIIKK